MTDRLAIADAVTLHAETATTPAHTVAVLVLEACEELSHPRLLQVVAQSLPQLARFRSRLVAKPMGAGQPLWAEIDDHDPTDRIHAATVPAPGGRLELAQLVTKLTAGVDDWRRSLWTAWTVDGLAGGQWALVLKMSPVLYEHGEGIAAVWQRLVIDGAPTPVVEAGAEPAPSVAELVIDTMAETIENQLTGAWVVAEAATNALLALRRRLSNVDDEPVDAAATPAPRRTPSLVFDAPLTRRRSTAFASIRLDDVNTITAAFGGSSVDVVLSACTLALRSYLLSCEAMPDAPLLIAVPLSMPTGDAARYPVTTGYLRAPIHLDDPVQVLSDIHTATEHLNFANAYLDEIGLPGLDFATAAALSPPWMSQAGMRLYQGLGLQRWRPADRDGTVSFTSLPPGHAQCAGADVVAMYIVEPLVEGCGVNVGVTAHGDVLDLCVTVCPDAVAGVEHISTGVSTAVDVLLAAAAESPRGEGRSVVTQMASHASRRP
jgi:diacylglycerol O-acyltransferase / wax synthase